MIKREYRGQRTAESLASYIRDQLKDPVSEVHNLDEIYELKVCTTKICLFFIKFCI